MQGKTVGSVNEQRKTSINIVDGVWAELQSIAAESELFAEKWGKNFAMQSSARR